MAILFICKNESIDFRNEFKYYLKDTQYVQNTTSQMNKAKCPFAFF